MLFFSSALEPDAFRCEIPQCDDGVVDPSFSDVPSSIFPLDDDDDEDYCQYYPPFANASSDTCFSKSVFDLDGRVVDCDTSDGNFLYKSFEMDETIVTEWDLVCDDQFKVVQIVFQSFTGPFTMIILGSPDWQHLHGWHWLWVLVLRVDWGRPGQVVDDHVLHSDHLHRRVRRSLCGQL